MGFERVKLLQENADQKEWLAVDGAGPSAMLAAGKEGGAAGARIGDTRAGGEWCVAPYTPSSGIGSMVGFLAPETECGRGPRAPCCRFTKGYGTEDGLDCGTLTQRPGLTVAGGT